MFSKNTKLSNGAVILFINLVIRPPVKEKTYNFIKFKKLTLIRKNGYAVFAYSNSPKRVLKTLGLLKKMIIY
jgi:hypothetical protein